MPLLAIRFLNILLVGITAGILVGIFIGYNPKSLSMKTYVEQQQNAIGALNTLMPIVGLITVILTLIAAYLQRDNSTVLGMLLVASALMIASGLITRFGNQPINAIVMTWSANDIPGNWSELRDKWWSLHVARTVSVTLAFCLIIWANLRIA